MQITVVGLGYVGLVTAAVMAGYWRHDVIAYDIDPLKVGAANDAKSTFYEPGLDRLLARAIKAKRLRATTYLPEAVPKGEFVFLCVGTPPRDDGSANLDALHMAVTDIAPYLQPDAIVVIKSTVPPKTAQAVRLWLDEASENVKNVDVVSCPEFLREGQAVADAVKPDRIVLGGEVGAITKVATLFPEGKCEIVYTTNTSAEVIKYASNAFLAAKISFINEMALLCDAVGANVSDVGFGMGLDKRIGPDFLSPGLGYGGSCFGKDVSALKMAALHEGLYLPMLDATQQVNARQLPHYLELVGHLIGGYYGARVGVLGLAFKPGTDDIRDSKAVEAVKYLLAEGAEVVVHDPMASFAFAAQYPDLPVVYAQEACDVANGCRAVILATAWEEYLSLDASDMARRMEGPFVFLDGRNAMCPTHLQTAGITYIGIGRSVE